MNGCPRAVFSWLGLPFATSLLLAVLPARAAQAASRAATEISAAPIVEKSSADDRPEPDDAVADEDDEDEVASREAARKLAYMAQEKFDARRYDQAISHGEQAFAIIPASTIALLLARAHREEGKYHLSTLWYRTASAPSELSDNQVLRQARRQARLELDELEMRFPRVRIDSREGKMTAALLDGTRMPLEAVETWLRVDPGRHLMEVEFESGRSLRQVFHIEAGQRRVLVFSRETVESPGPARAYKAAGIASLSVGAAALGTGAGFALRARAISRGLDEDCPDRSCPASEEKEVRAYKTARAVSTASYVLGAVASTGGALMLWRGANAGPVQDLGVMVSPDRVTLKGVF